MSGDSNEVREFEILEACGSAVGFALAAASQEGAAIGTREGLHAFARNLHTLCDHERFSPDVSIAMGGIVAGIAAWLKLDPTKDEWL